MICLYGIFIIKWVVYFVFINNRIELVIWVKLFNVVLVFNSFCDYIGV